MLPTPSKPLPSLPTKRLSLEELTLRCEGGLCFNYDEKFYHDHKCAFKAFLLIADDDEAFQEDNPVMEPLPDPPDTHELLQALINLHTLSGHLAPETLRLLGHIAAQQVVILVDGGSTHNFIQEHLVHQLGRSPCTTTPLKVMVDNGHQLDCHLLHEAIPLHVQNVTFTVDLHVLPLCGANLVLGV